MGNPVENYETYRKLTELEEKTIGDVSIKIIKKGDDIRFEGHFDIGTECVTDLMTAICEIDKLSSIYTKLIKK